MGPIVPRNAVQEVILDREHPRSLYVHAPFCARRCFYCDFPVTVASQPDLQGWLRAIETELEMVRSEGFFSPAASLETLFVGGGTPSFLGASAMAGLARVLGLDGAETVGMEWTAEANPDSFTEKMNSLRSWWEMDPGPFRPFDFRKAKSFSRSRW